MSNMVRAITEDGSAFATAIDSTAIVSEIEKTQCTSAVVTAAIGRLTTAASMMGVLLKGENDSLTIRMNGGGKTGSIISVANSSGNVKAYVENPVVELPLNKHGKLDVAGAVGTDGALQVIKDLGLKEPYMGQIPIETGEIAEDITKYYAVSEQTPTVCSLGVLVNPDLTVKAAGGFMIQLLPYADESVIEVIERNINGFEPISSLIEQGVTPEQIVMRLLDGLKPNLLDELDTEYKCDCSRERVEKALMSMGEEELRKMAEEEEVSEVSCHFCRKKFWFNKSSVLELIKNKKSNKF